jgi:hypothetical protein
VNRLVVKFAGSVLALGLATGAQAQSAAPHSPAADAFSRLPAAARTPIANVLKHLSPKAWAQLAELTASDGATNDIGGASIAYSKDVVVIGAPQEGATHFQGAAYVFVKPKTGWKDATETAKLTASDGAAGDVFGSGVAIEKNTIVVGAPGATVNGNAAEGAAYVFTRPKSGWQSTSTFAAKIYPSDGQRSASFGKSVAMAPKTIVVGAPATVGARPGEAYVYVEPKRGWKSGSQTAILTALDGAAGDYFGRSVATDGNTIVVGAPDATVGGFSQAGAGYLFVKPADGWINSSQTTKLTAGDVDPDNYLGCSVALAGGTVVLGSYGWPGTGADLGAAYVYVEPKGGWQPGMTQTARLTASDGVAINLGYAVAIDKKEIVAGSPYTNINGKLTYRGALYVYQKPASGWANSNAETLQLGADDNDAYENLGWSLAIGKGVIAAGAPNLAVGANTAQGGGFVFGR